jgi:hypothetical protein
MSKPVQTIIEDWLYFIKRYYSADEVIEQYPQTLWADLNLAAYEKMGGIFVVKQYDSFSIILKDTEVDRIFNSRNDEMNAIPFLVRDQEFRNTYYSIIAENGFFLYSLNSFIKNGDSKVLENKYPQVMDIIKKEKDGNFGGSEIYFGYNLEQLAEITDLSDEDIQVINAIMFQDEHNFSSLEYEYENWQSAYNGDDLRNHYLWTKDPEQKLWFIQSFLAPYVKFDARTGDVNTKVFETFFPGLVDDILEYQLEYVNDGLFNANKSFIQKSFFEYFSEYGFIYDFEGDYLITTVANLMVRGVTNSKTYFSLPDVLRSIFKKSFADYEFTDVFALDPVYSPGAREKLEEGLQRVFTQMLQEIKSGPLKEGVTIRDKILKMPKLFEKEYFRFSTGLEIKGPIEIQKIRPVDNKLILMDYYGKTHVLSLEELLDSFNNS